MAKNIIFKTGHGKTLLRLLREEAGLIGTKRDVRKESAVLAQYFWMAWQ